MKNLTKLGTVAMVSLIFWLSVGCATDPNYKSDSDKAVDACIEHGGMPTTSAWNGEFNGCIFPPQQNR